jgi:hypothetical protein
MFLHEYNENLLYENIIYKKPINLLKLYVTVSEIQCSSCEISIFAIWWSFFQGSYNDL